MIDIGIVVGKKQMIYNLQEQTTTATKNHNSSREMANRTKKKKASLWWWWWFGIAKIDEWKQETMMCVKDYSLFKLSNCNYNIIFIKMKLSFQEHSTYI